VLTRELAKLEGAKSEERKAAADAAAQRAKSDGSSSEAKSEPWDDEDEVKTLDKACNQKFPMGTKDRWERVAEYMCEHGKRVRSAKEVMTRYKAGL
jgi:DnaJ family protein C protein 2